MSPEDKAHIHACKKFLNASRALMTSGMIGDDFVRNQRLMMHGFTLASEAVGIFAAAIVHFHRVDEKIDIDNTIDNLLETVQQKMLESTASLRNFHIEQNKKREEEGE